MAFIGNKVTEKDLRDHLESIGYIGRSARFLRLELTGIERPGWIQLFEFHVEAKKRDGDWEPLFGICRDDERSQTFEVQLLSNPDQQKQSGRFHSETMITLDRPAAHVEALLGQLPHVEIVEADSIAKECGSVLAANVVIVGAASRFPRRASRIDMRRSATSSRSARSVAASTRGV